MVLQRIGFKSSIQIHFLIQFDVALWQRTDHLPFVAFHHHHHHHHLIAVDLTQSANSFTFCHTWQIARHDDELTNQEHRSTQSFRSVSHRKVRWSNSSITRVISRLKLENVNKRFTSASFWREIATSRTKDSNTAEGLQEWREAFRCFSFHFSTDNTTESEKVGLNKTYCNSQKRRFLLRVSQ